MVIACPRPTMLLATILPNATPRRRPLLLPMASAFILLLLLAFLNLGRWLDREDPLQKASAIAVLSGRMPDRALEPAGLALRDTRRRVGDDGQTAPAPGGLASSLVLDICPDYSSAHERAQGLLGRIRS